MRPVGAALKISIPGQPVSFAQEITRILAQTSYADALREPRAGTFSKSCLILDGSHLTIQEVERLVQEQSDEHGRPMVICVGGSDRSRDHPPDWAYLPRSLLPETLEWTLDQFSRSAWLWSGRVERRAHRRYHYHAPIAPSTLLVDLSECGAQLETTESLAVGATKPFSLGAAFPLLPEPLSLRVTACRSTEKAGTHRIHGCFWRLTDRMRLALAETLFDIGIQ